MMSTRVAGISHGHLQPQFPPAARPKRAGRIGWLDGLRALAVLGVVAVHATPTVHNLPAWVGMPARLGQYGVQLFFVISAITIYLTLQSHLLRSGDSIRSWYARRFFRIAPLYYMAIPLYAVFDRLTMRISHIASGTSDPRAYLANVLFVHGWIPLGNNNVVPGGWSIGVEMSFYVIAPALFCLLTRSRWWPVAFLGFAALSEAAVIVIAQTFWGTSHVENNSYLYYCPFTQFPIFLVGLALVHLSKPWLLGESPIPPRWMVAAWVTAGTSLPAAFACGTWMGLSPQLAPLLFGIGFCALVILAHGPLQMVFGNAVARYVGRVSYSIYIVHFVVVGFIHFLVKRTGVEQWAPSTLVYFGVMGVTVVLSVALASLTYRFIEEPGNKLGSWAAAKLH